MERNGKVQLEVSKNKVVIFPHPSSHTSQIENSCPNLSLYFTFLYTYVIPLLMQSLQSLLSIFLRRDVDGGSLEHVIHLRRRKAAFNIWKLAWHSQLGFGVTLAS